MANHKGPLISESQRRVTRSMANKPSIDTKVVVKVEKQKKKTQKAPAGVVLSASRIPPIHKDRFGLIQESVATDLYALLVAAVLWNRTRGSQARPVFLKLISKYPTPHQLADAAFSDLADLIRPIGLYNSRAARFIAFAKTWIDSPPCKTRRYRKLHYPLKGDGLDIGKNEVLDEAEERHGWEVAHLPSLGPYAIDSYRIFHRDMLRGLAKNWNGFDAAPDFEPEWKRVVPLDKELRAYLRWMWLKEGWIWDPETGDKVKASNERMDQERARCRSLSPEGFRVVRR
ncbi:related to 5-methylcytosine G/T mismatch-specific DNA glycosylase [Fusarium torulosum]|uniref:Related to 5-methylcytosine G/T mismatch-specific DNA glycosylase n=1 Tax=Fusarium torulosum TaxID=33205 RepID=A0AAE8SGQ1_9HYPO|nr:related to 5-methylcytosine G/T mismatch-specific DNA glycosylase [Fusarium torulosum]